MARVDLPAGITSISGKIGNVCFRTMKSSGRVYMSRMPSPRSSQPSEKEIAARELFRKKAQTVALMKREGSRLSHQELWREMDKIYPKNSRQ